MENITEILKVGKIGKLRIMGKLGKFLNYSTLFKIGRLMHLCTIYMCLFFYIFGNPPLDGLWPQDGHRSMGQNSFAPQDGHAP